MARYLRTGLSVCLPPDRIGWSGKCCCWHGGERSWLCAWNLRPIHDVRFEPEIVVIVLEHRLKHLRAPLTLHARHLRQRVASGGPTEPGRRLHKLPRRAATTAQGDFLARLKISRTSASNNDRSGLSFADGDPGSIGQGCNDFEPNDEMLLELFPSPVIRRCDPELEALPRNGKIGKVRVQILVGHDV